MYARGDGVTEDDVEAVKWYRLAAAQGDANGQTKLGLMYEKGVGVTKNYADAVKWFRLAAKQGDSGAQSYLGVMYFNGNGVAQDYVRAHMWSNLGGAAGDDFGKKVRNLAAAKMTPQQIADAQKLASECQQRKFKDCDWKANYLGTRLCALYTSRNRVTARIE
jgi:hypothetical protein